MTATPENDFLLPGLTCDCGPDFHCDNHDRDAIAAYWLDDYLKGTR